MALQEQQRVEYLEYEVLQLKDSVQRYKFQGSQGWVGNQTLQSGYLQSSNFVQSSSGFRLTADGVIYAVGAVISGSITATSGTIGGWSINSTSIYTGTEDHAAYTANAGDITIYSDGANASIHAFKWYIGADGSFNSTLGTMSGVSIASIPNDTSTDISLLDFTHDLVFSETDADTVAWATGTITMSNARTFSITGSNTGNMTLKTYIYLDTAVSSTVLQTTTTVATAMGANKKLIAVAQNGTGAATWQVNEGIGGLKITAAMTSVANNDWTFSGAWSVTDADTVAWGAGTLTTSNGGSYSITGSNTGNMVAKTYIYFALGTSSTAFQTTTTAATAVGEGKILIATAQNATGEAKFIVMNDQAYNIDAANIIAGSITANEIAASTITGANIASLNITSKTATIDTGTIGGWTLSSTTLTGGNATLGSTGVLTLGTSNDVVIASAADATYRLWTGHATAASAPFRVTKAGAVTATSATITGSITATSGTIAGWTINSTNLTSPDGRIVLESDANGTDAYIQIDDNGWIQMGAATAPLTGNGVFIGYDQVNANTFDMRAGDPAATYFHWDDSANTLKIEGGSLNVGTTGNVRGGQTAYNTGTGFFLGYESAAHKFSIGDGTNKITWDGTTFAVSGLNLVQVTTYSSGSGNWTKPTGAKTVLVQLWGAGGGGGGVTLINQSGGAGGGGAYVEHIFNAADISATAAYAVGAGGAGNTGNGTVGGNTTFAATSITLTAYGGGGGGGDSATGGGGGGGGGVKAVGSVGQATDGGAGGSVAGGAGGGSGAAGAASTLGGGGGGGGNNGAGGESAWGGGGGGASGSTGTGGVGGASWKGGGGGGGSASAAGGTSTFGGAGGAGGSSANGTAGTAPGGGGGGTRNIVDGTDYSGGAGAAGKIVVTAYL